MTSEEEASFVYPTLGRRILLQVYDPEVLLLFCPQDGLKQVGVDSATAPVGVGHKPVQVPVVWGDVSRDTSPQQSHLSSR